MVEEIIARRLQKLTRRASQEVNYALRKFSSHLTVAKTGDGHSKNE
jgi:hypothetical protein